MLSKFRNIAIVAVLAISGGFFAASPAEAAGFKTCAALQKSNPYGIGIKNAKDKVKTGNSSVKNFKVVSTVTYNSSKNLDTDKDKIICERIKYKNCLQANKTYKHGAGLKGAKDKSTKPVINFTVIVGAIYNTNKHLDRDKDKIFCEKN